MFRMSIIGGSFRNRGSPIDGHKNPSMPLTPPHFRKGDLIALISPASPPSSSEKVEGAVRYLENRGYAVEVGKHVLDVHGYLAGTDDARLEDLNGFIRNEKVKGIIAIRGGYGTPRLLQRVDYESLRKNPKVIVGYSDLTGLQNAIFSQTGLVTFSGPMAGVEMWEKIDPYTEEMFWRTVENGRVGKLDNPREEPVSVLKGGTGEGVLIGGNFSLFMNLFGTPYLPDVNKAVLVLEDVDEAPHRIDRMLTQLRNSGLLGKLSALIFGAFTDCGPSDPEKPYLSVEELQKEFAQYVNGPVMANIRYGHIPRKMTLPIGGRVRVDGNRGTLELLA